MNAAQSALLELIQTYKDPTHTDLEAALNVIGSHAVTISRLRLSLIAVRGAALDLHDKAEAALSFTPLLIEAVETKAEASADV